MILSARRNSGPIARRGCVILYRSRDLARWEHYGPIYDPKHTNCPECPELYRIADTWYLSYSRFSEFGGTIYRMSDNPFGGWRTPRRDRIGSRRFYAAKSMADDKGGRYYFGWTAGQSRQQRQGRMVLGRRFRRPARGRAVVEKPRASGQASAGDRRRLPAADRLAFTGRSKAGRRRLGIRCASESVGTLTYGFFEVSQPRFLLSCKVRPLDCRDYFGFAIKSDRNLARTLLLTFETAAQTGVAAQLPDARGPVLGSFRRVDGDGGPARSGWAARRRGIFRVPRRRGDRREDSHRP